MSNSPSVLKINLFAITIQVFIFSCSKNIASFVVDSLEEPVTFQITKLTHIVAHKE